MHFAPALYALALALFLCALPFCLWLERRRHPNGQPAIASVPFVRMLYPVDLFIGGFFVGWAKSHEWHLARPMGAWTISWLASAIASGCAAIVDPQFQVFAMIILGIVLVFAAWEAILFATATRRVLTMWDAPSRESVIAVADIKTTAIPHLLEVFERGERDARTAATEVLAGLGVHLPIIKSTFQIASADPDPVIRELALAALAKGNAPAKEKNSQTPTPTQ